MKPKKSIRCKFGKYTIRLDNVREGLHSEETLDYMAQVHYKFGGGKYQQLAVVSNDGHGGCTDFHPTSIDSYKWFRVKFDLIQEELKKHNWTFYLGGKLYTFKYDMEHLCNTMAAYALDGYGEYILEDLLADNQPM